MQTAPEGIHRATMDCELSQGPSAYWAPTNTELGQGYTSHFLTGSVIHYKIEWGE